MNATRRRRWGRAALWLVAGVLLLEVAYVVGANLWLAGSGARALAERRPDRVRVDWRSAWTPFPGHVVVRGLELRVQTRAVQWGVTAETVSGWVALHELTARRFHARRLAARGVEVRARRQPVDGPPTERDRLAPPFPEFAAPPPKPPTAAAREPWAFHLADLELDGVRDVWVNELHWTGSASAGLDLFVQGGRRVRLGRSWLEIDQPADSAPPSVVTLRPDLRLEDLEGRAEGSIDEFDPRRERGWAILGRARGRLVAAGTTPSGGVLDFYLRPQNPTLQVAGGRGPVRADLRLDRGRWLDGSQVEGAAPDLAARLVGVVARGDGRWVWRVEGGGPRLVMTFDSYRVDAASRAGGEATPAPPPFVEGTGLEVESAPERREGIEAFRGFLPLRVTLTGARVPDLRVLNAYLPAASGLRVTSGTASLSGELREPEGAPRPGLLSGALRLSASGARVHALGRRLVGDAELDLRIQGADWEAQDFPFAGTRLRLANVRMTGGGDTPHAPWWARFDVDEGRMRPGRTPYFTARGRGRLRDSWPIVALAAERRPLPDWVQRVLEVDDVAASGAIALSHGQVRLRDVRAQGEDIELRGEFRRSDARGPSGIFYARWRGLDAAMRVEGEERDFKILRPLEWFEAQRAGLPASP